MQKSSDMILQYHLSKGHTRNALLDPVNQKIYFIPSEIEALEKVIADHTEYPDLDYSPMSMEHLYSAWLELLEFDLNFELLEEAFQFASECLCSYLMIRVHNQEDLERLFFEVSKRKQLGQFSLHQLYLATTFEAKLRHLIPDPNNFIKVIPLRRIEAERQVRLEGFNIYQKLIVQAHHSNLFYDRRLFLNQEGYLQPSPESDYLGAPLANFMGQPEAILKDSELIRLWDITKDQVQTCRDCEFKRICQDPSDLLLQEDGSYLRASPCTYDPYKGEWVTTTTEPTHIG